MNRFLMLGLGVVLATGCYQTSDTVIEKQTTPPGTAADGITLPSDAWTSDGCATDADCVDAVSPGYCERAACVAGSCKKVAVAPGTTCADPTVAVQACEARQCLVQGDALACVANAAPDGLPCGVFYAACGGTGVCAAGNCVDPCIGHDPCKVGSCGNNGCEYQAVNEGGACNDGNSCTTNDVCTDGVCGGTLTCQCAKDIDCKALDDDNLCNGVLVCQSGQCKVKAGSVVSCLPTGNEPCFVNECNPETGLCEEGYPTQPTPCDDGIDCTKGDKCKDGTCSDFANVTCEYLCDDTTDEDDDNLTDCDDPDCWGQPGCPAPTCGDGTCNGEEKCDTCEQDCGVCPPVCGDGECNGEETCGTCALDCGVCPPACGDGTCNGTEVCGTCPADCGACPPECGDGECNGAELCGTCPSDCGVCPPSCGDGSCNGVETCTSCETDCGACPPACGDGTCNGTEDCTSCASDCGACPSCGDGTCNGTEDCSTCEADCGTCPCAECDADAI